MSTLKVGIFTSVPKEDGTYEVHFVNANTGEVLVIVPAKSLKTMFGAVHAIVSDDLPRAYFTCKSELHCQLIVWGSPEDGVQVTLTNTETSASCELPLDDLLLTLLVAELKD